MRLPCAAFLAFCVSVTMAVAQPSGVDAPDAPAKVELLFTPNHNLLQVKLAVDAMIDPATNIRAVTASVDRMATAVSVMAGVGANSAAKLTALKRYLYERGSWNGNKPFQYDMDDLLGEKLSNRMLQRYLTTRRGNCITMPLLMLFIGQRIGLKLTLAEAPLHRFLKYTDDEGTMWNLEATSGGGFTRDAWYRLQLPMSDRAVTNGVYLRPLSHGEATALIAVFLVERDLATRDFERAIAVSDVLLRHHSRFVYGLVKKGSAYRGLLFRELAGKYRRMEDIPVDLKRQADAWYAQNMQAFDKAEALGWRPEDGQMK